MSRYYEQAHQFGVNRQGRFRAPLPADGDFPISLETILRLTRVSGLAGPRPLPSGQYRRFYGTEAMGVTLGSARR